MASYKERYHHFHTEECRYYLLAKSSAGSTLSRESLQGLSLLENVFRDRNVLADQKE
jgi:hypothetical protein